MTNETESEIKTENERKTESKTTIRNTVNSFAVKRMIVEEGELTGAVFFILSFDTDDTKYEFLLLPEEVKRIEESCHRITDDMQIETESLPPFEEMIPPREFFPDYH